MKALYQLAAVGAVATLLVAAKADAPVADEQTAAAMVGPDGSIVMTVADYQRDWTVLGVFAHLGDDGVRQFNVVYTQPESATAYRATGAFPAGTVIVKELREGTTAKEGDDKVSSLGLLTGWFVLIKPPETGGPEGPLWGEGWGWAKFNVDAPSATITTSYKTDCIGCHEPVRSTDFIHIEGYPLLRK